MPFLEHAGIRFHYEVSGEGPCLAFAHGLTGSLENARELIGALPGYRQFFWDARGHGQTSPAGPNQGFTFEAFAQDLAALLDVLEISRAIIGGISMGAAVSARFAVRYPERVRALILVRPAWLTEGLPEGLQLMPLVADHLERLGPEKGCELFVQSPAYQALLEREPETAALLRDQFFVPEALERRARLSGIPGDAPIRSWSEVEGLQIPTLVLGNEPDYVHPISYARLWAQRLPLGRFAQVPAKSAGFEPYALGVRNHIAGFLKSLEESQ